MEQMPAGTVLVPCVFGDPGETSTRSQVAGVAGCVSDTKGSDKEVGPQEIRHLYPW